MLDLFRKFMSSKLGVGITLTVLVVIAVGFVLGDVGNFGRFGSVGGADSIATVGKTHIEAAEVSMAAKNALENAKQQNPTMSMKAMIAAGGLDQVLDRMISLAAFAEFGRAHGVVASSRLIDSEIAKQPQFHGPDGRFSDTAFRGWLAQNGLSEAAFRNNIAQILVLRQLAEPASFGATAPQEMVLRYASLLTDTRTGAIAMIPSAVFAPKTPPTDAELQAWYNRNRNHFIKPERRVIRYASFDESVLKNVPAPTEAEIVQRYNADKSQYAALETRKLTQVIVPTEAAARAIAAEAGGGKSLGAVASAKGLAASAIGPIGKSELTSQASAAVADAAFNAANGAMAAPAKSALGWHVIHVDAVERRPERTLDQVRGEIAKQLADEKRRKAINDMSAHLEDEFDNGGNLVDAAKELGVTLQSTEPLTADGKVYANPDQPAPPVLARAIPTAFSMENENQPQLAEVVPGKTFVIFEVTNIAASAAAPLSEVRDAAATGVMLEKGLAAAKASAQKVLDMAQKGTDLQAALASLHAPLPPVDRVQMNHVQISQPNQTVPPPIVLLFRMAQGTVKLLPAAQNRGWYVVQLSKIEPGKVDPANPALAQLRTDFSQTVGEEYVAQLGRAARNEIGVKRNENAYQALRNQLNGGT